MDYELALVLKVQPTDEARSDLLQKISEVFGNFGFALERLVVKEELEGRRKLAYPIRNQTEGIYCFFNVKFDQNSAKQGSIVKVTKMLKNDKYLSSNILRYLIIKKNNL